MVAQGTTLAAVKPMTSTTSFHTAEEVLRNEFAPKASGDGRQPTRDFTTVIPEEFEEIFHQAKEQPLMTKINRGHIDLVTFEDCQQMIELIGEPDAVHEVTFLDTDGDFVAFRLNTEGFLDYYANGHMLLNNLTEVLVEGNKLSVKGAKENYVRMSSLSGVSLKQGFSHHGRRGSLQSGSGGHFICSVPQVREHLAARVLDLFNGRRAGKMKTDMLRYLLKEVLEPNFSDVEVEDVLQHTDQAKDGLICTQELLSALLAAPVRHLVKHLQREMLEVSQRIASSHCAIDRDFLLQKLDKRVRRDDAFFTLPFALGLLVVLCILVILHLQVWKRKQVEWGLENWMNHGEFHLDDQPAVASATSLEEGDDNEVSFEDVKDIDTFWYWLDNDGLESIAGSVINFRKTGVAVPQVGGSHLLIGGLRINQEIWLLQPDTPRNFTSTRASPFLAPLRERLLQDTLELRAAGPEAGSVHIEFITYSEKSQFFSVFDINLDLDNYGYVKPVMSATAVMFRAYPTPLPYVADFVYLLLLATLFYHEFGQVTNAARQGRREFARYWGIWNTVDWLSISLGLAGSVIWYMCVSAMGNPALTSLMGSDGDRFHIAYHVDVMALSEERLDDIMDALYELQNYFLAIQLTTLAAVVAVMLKCFKGFRANPRLAIVSETLKNSARDIGHFFIVFFFIFFIFALTGHVLFGNDRPEFYTLASSVKTGFKVLMGDFTWYVELTDNSSEQNHLSSGIPRLLLTLWFFVFVMLVSLVMLNMLLAVIFEQYIQVVESNRLPDTDGTLWSQTRRFWMRRRETMGFIALSKILDMLVSDENPAHPQETVTETSLEQAFPTMKVEQAKWIMDWLQQENMRELERDRELEYGRAQIVEIIARNERYGNHISEQVRSASLGVANWETHLGGFESNLSTMRKELEAFPAQLAIAQEGNMQVEKSAAILPLAELGRSLEVTDSDSDALKGKDFDESDGKWSCRVLDPELLDASTEYLRVTVRPHGVLGLQRTPSGTPRRAPLPDSTTAIVDAADLRRIQESPGNAGDTAAAVYEWLGIAQDAKFPDPVREAIQGPSAAKFHSYGSKCCIHVVGPDFRVARGISREQCVQRLAVAYQNVLAEFATTPALGTLRLLPIGDGGFAGGFSADLPMLTAEALQLAFRQLQPGHRSLVQGEGRSLEMCVFDEGHLAKYEEAFASVASRSSELSSLLRQSEEQEEMIRALETKMSFLVAKCEAMRTTQAARVQIVRGNLRQQTTECCPIRGMAPSTDATAPPELVCCRSGSGTPACYET